MSENPKRVKFRIGLVGCGKIANNHMNALSQLKDQFEIISVCDPNSAALNHASSTYNVRIYPTLTRMLDSHPELDLVTLCSPSGLHAEQTIEVANRKINVVTEKPMATRWSDGLKMVKACDEAQVKLFVVKQNRYQPALQLLKKALNENKLGQIYLVNLNVFWTRPQSYYDQAKWRGTWEFDGGAFMNQASHYVDLLDWLIGPVQSVQAMMGTLAIKMEAEDTGVLNIRWRNGALGSMSVTMLTYPKNLEASLTVLGEKGSVRIGGVSANQIQHWEVEDAPELSQSIAELNQAQSEVHSYHTDYYRNVAQVLDGKAEPHTDGRAGLRSLEILIAAYLSARDNKTVNLPFVY